MSNLLGNPHSASASSQLATRRIEDIRLQVLQFFNASPDYFDIVFVANATAGIKLVTEALREQEGGFWFGYHCDSHTSLVGARQAANAGHYCFESDIEVEDWLSSRQNIASFAVLPSSDQREHVKEFAHSEEGNKCFEKDAAVSLFAYPAQSNMSGRRLSLSWLGRVRSRGLAQSPRIYTLLDAAALVSTSPLDLSDVSAAPDFTVCSFNKIFGFPDLGALIVRKEAGDVLGQRQYFGGGTVEMVTCLKEQWHIKKQSLHEQLEDGTLPIHSIMAIESALSVHGRLFGSMHQISSHTQFLAKWIYDQLAALHHSNGRQVCAIYKDKMSSYDDARTQGPVIAFNLLDSQGHWVSNAEVEKLANIKNIHLRTGGLCNPGGVAHALNLEPWEMKRNFSAGQRCGNDHDIMGGKPTGVIRISLGAMSNLSDVQTFVHFIEEFFVDRQQLLHNDVIQPSLPPSIFYVESLSIYPIKSCGGWSIPSNTRWDIRAEGLAWDREWCLVHKGTRESLSQKRYPEMALIKPVIDFNEGVLRIRYVGFKANGPSSEVTVPLSADPSVFGHSQQDFASPASRVCGDIVQAQTYASQHIASFFSAILGTPCTLARFPPSSSPASSARHSKAHLQPHQTTTRPSDNPRPVGVPKRPILLSNESPILTISRSSLDALNAEIFDRDLNAKIASHAVFRANIVLAQETCNGDAPQPYIEDTWRSLQITPQQDPASNQLRATTLEMLGSCRRCQMVCVDQATAEKNAEPFSTLAKTRRMGGKVWFGVHGGLASGCTMGSIAVGDRVQGVTEEESS